MQKNKFTKRTSRRVSNRRLMIDLARLFAMIFVCIGLACSGDTSSTKPTPSPANSSQQGGRDEVRIELTQSGFMPSEVKHLAGAFAIVIENTSGRDEYALRLKTADGTVLNEIQVQKGSTAWSVSLQPGVYTLTEASHQEWTCRINVQ